jgi:hypothetical protein
MSEVKDPDKNAWSVSIYVKKGSGRSRKERKKQEKLVVVTAHFLVSS